MEKSVLNWRHYRFLFFLYTVNQGLECWGHQEECQHPMLCWHCSLPWVHTWAPISERHLEVVAKLIHFIFSFKTLCFKIQCFFQTVGTQMVLQDFSLSESLSERFKILALSPVCYRYVFIIWLGVLENSVKIASHLNCYWNTFKPPSLVNIIYWSYILLYIGNL